MPSKNRKPKSPLISKWGNPEERMNSCHGEDISYREWCDSEVERIGGAAHVVTNKHGEIAVYR
jgi:hypothetical protein